MQELYDAYLLQSKVYERHDKHRIACLDIHPQTGRLFVGTSHGHVEEHIQAEHGCTRLMSDKKVSKIGIQQLHLWRNTDKLVVLTDAGTVLILSCANYSSYQIPNLSSANSIASAHSSPSPKLAVCHSKPSASGSEVLIYSPAKFSSLPLIQIDTVQLPEPCSGMAWLHDTLFLQLPRGYQAYTQHALLDIAPGVTNRSLLSACAPQADVLLLFAERCLKPTNASGHATRAALVLPDSPIAVCHDETLIVAAFHDRVSVFDRDTGEVVQQIAFAHDDAWVRSRGVLPCVVNPSSGAVLLATSSRVACLWPVAQEQQVHQLLCKRHFTAVLRLLERAGACPPSSLPAWLPSARAQTGLLMLQALDTQRAFEVLQACPVDVFQPAQLLVLVPDLAGRWLEDAASQAQTYWGLGEKFTDAETMVRHHLKQVTPTPHESTDTFVDPEINTSVSRTRDDAYDAAVDAAMARVRKSLARYLVQARTQSGVKLRNAIDSVTLMLAAECLGGAEVEDIACDPGNECVVDVCVPALRAAHRHHAVGLLLLSKGGVGDALEQWRQLAEGGVQESPSHCGAIATAHGNAAQVAAQHACSALLSSTNNNQLPTTNSHPQVHAPNYPDNKLHTKLLNDRKLHGMNFSEGQVLAMLRWMLCAWPPAALTVLLCTLGPAAELDIGSVLGLCEGREDDVRWRYLWWLVDVRGCKEPDIHTELAIELVEYITRHSPDNHSTAHTTTSSAHGSGSTAHPAISSAHTTIISAHGSGSTAHTTTSSAHGSGNINTTTTTTTTTATTTNTTNNNATTNNSHSRTTTNNTNNDYNTSTTTNNTIIADNTHSRTTHNNINNNVYYASTTTTNSTITANNTPTTNTTTTNPSAHTTTSSNVRHITSSVGEAREVLHRHLSESTLYDARFLLWGVMAGRGGMVREQVVLCIRLGEHAHALRLLALVQHDVSAAMVYVEEHVGPEGWMVLLDLLLRPGEGFEPDYDAAIRVLNAEGAALNQVHVLSCLSDDMPLHLAAPTLTRCATTVMHKHRQGQVVRELSRARGFDLRQQLCALQAISCMTSEESWCRGCGRVLGSRVFHRLPDGELRCNRCMRPEMDRRVDA